MPKKKSSADITCDIKKVYAVLSKNGCSKKIFASISWNGGEPHDEIRNVINTEYGERVLKGISLTEDEMEKLIATYKKLKKKRENTPDKNIREYALTSFSSDEIQGVDLFDIYQSAAGIMQKRAEGNLTKDGLIILESL